MSLNKDEILLNRDELKAAAAEFHARGFNCAQSVACALAPALRMDERTVFTLTEGFGAGMGGMTETCGAISGAVVALGQVESTGFDEPTSKGRTYKLARTLCARFAEKNGSNVCRELKGVGSEAGPLRSCAGCIDDAIDLFCDVVIEQGAREA
ncbi:MAG: C-GCAxxG-C-C family protein [Coriobacteriaceae bacterium]|nr:C-GCAxxG-C-C family protein [Coriobacteriaceae bacterium]